MSGQEIASPIDVQFGEDKIIAIPGISRDDWSVVLKPTCESMGVDFNGQYQKLKREHWARMCVTHIRDSGGRVQETITIDRPTFKMWMLKFTTSRIKNPAARAKIEYYQLEAMDVLDSHFGDTLQRVTPTPQELPSPASNAREIARAILQLCDQQDEQNGKIANLDQRLSVLEQNRAHTKAMIEAPAEPFITPPQLMTLSDFLWKNRIGGIGYNARGDIGVWLKRWCVRTRTKYTKEPGQRAQWPIKALEKWKEEFDDAQ